MNIQELNEKYMNLCNRFSVPVRISLTNDANAPKQQISEGRSSSIITLNTATIASGDYEMFLAYNIGKVLLPRLMLETDRLVLRRYRPEDANDCFAFLSDAKGCYLDCCKPFAEMDEEYYQRMEQFRDRETQYMIVFVKVI